ncbi:MULTISPECIES: SDR family NAD(P)-dependent oxidoreductase [unclassified Aureimonas]|uniref:SDR family NAD(P)-dependent oxidoreductase n=1 Tax=unclassified Aureimonas TaxID=2615206 RepID=UPI0007006BC2|nr:MULTISPECIES: SDR family oxidoreductase [unclassified Aureimonas]KQT63296.1 short-chain dehydrogenase [Aureimonas sp. Leaf427]KQT80124.1 short-chain dehydrogenase [Aureimonas sp. Leaf460]
MTLSLFPRRFVLVTGVGGGIGRSIATAFAREGAKLLLVGRRKAELEDTAEIVRDTGGDARSVVADITDEAAMARVFDGIDRLDVAVNAAGTIASGALDEMEADAFQRVLSVNTFGLWLSMKHEIRTMKASGGGTIVNIGSNIGARLVRPAMGAYAASKAAVSSLSRTAAVEALPFGIRINCLCPGPVDTPMSLRPGEDRAARDGRIALTNPSKRVARPQEIAATAIWLASDAAAYVVGQDIVIDGGASI